MLCVLLTTLIMLSYYMILTSYSTETVTDKVLLSAVLTSAQIVLSELLSGLFSGLYFHNIVAINISIALIILLLSYSRLKGRLSSAITSDINTCHSSINTSIDGYNAVLGILVFSVYGWVLLSAYYLPIRGIDDLYYHLPPIFEYIQSHQIRLLPIKLHTSFAFPENAELLYLWPTMLSSDQRMVDSLNVPFVMLSIVTLYAICRHFNISNRDSLFASLLYALCPVIIMQSGTNYIDIIVSLYLLISLYFAVKFYDSQRLLYLYATAVSIGMMSGMKYTAVFLAVPLHLMVMLKPNTLKKRHMFFYVALTLVLCGWWYLRNSFVLGDAFYPMDLVDSIFGNRSGGEGPSVININTIRDNLYKWLLRYPLEDIGVGSIDGGFGLVFWGLGFSSWIYIAISSIINFKIADINKYIILLYLPIGFLLLLIVQEGNVQFASRFSIYVVAIGLFALCHVFNELNSKALTNTFKAVCMILSLMTISLMTISNMPTYNLGNVITDKIQHKFPSQFKYLTSSIPEYAELRYVWEPLDFITRNDAVGLNCFVVANADLFNTAPVFGSNLQNRVLNFNSNKHEPVDAYLFLYANRFARLLGNHLLPQDVKISNNYSAYDLLFDSNYMIVTRSENGCLVLHKSIINKIDKLVLLQSYYQDTWPEAIKAAKQILPLLSKDIPVMTSGSLGYGIRYFDFTSGKTDRVLFTLEGMEELTAARMKISQCYTFDMPLNGYKTIHIANCIYKSRKVPIYLNSAL